MFERTGYRICTKRGFSLLEVLIAVVVLSIGLLGLAGLQFMALRGNNQSYERTQAHVLAYELADAMRANRVAAGRDKAFELDVDDPTPVVGTDCAAGPCTQADAAAFALARWHARMRVVLPSGNASIICSTPACGMNLVQTISVIWDENRLGVPSNVAGPATSCPTAFNPAVHLACVQVSFMP